MDMCTTYLTAISSYFSLFKFMTLKIYDIAFKTWRLVTKNVLRNDYPVHVHNLLRGKEIIYYKHTAVIDLLGGRWLIYDCLVINYYLQFGHHIVKAQKMKGKTQKKKKHFTNFGDIFLKTS